MGIVYFATLKGMKICVDIENEIKCVLSPEV